MAQEARDLNGEGVFIFFFSIKGDVSALSPLSICILYIYTLLQLKTGRSLVLQGDYFSLVTHLELYIRVSIL